METPADYTVLDGPRLVAYVWSRDGGSLTRAGARGDASAVPLAWGDVRCFEASRHEALAGLAREASDLEAFLFKLRFEGFEVRPGCLRPTAAHRRF